MRGPCTSRPTTPLRCAARLTALACAVLVAACGTVSDFASDGGPRVYGGVRQSGRNLSRHIDLGHPMSALLTVLDFPFSAVFDTLLLPASIAKSAGEVDPVVENERALQAAYAQLAIALAKGLENGTAKIAVLEFTDLGGRVGPELRAKLDAGLRKALEDTGRAGPLVPTDTTKKTMADNGITALDDPLVVRSLGQQLDAGSLVTATCDKSDLKLTLKVSLRSAQDGLEHANASAEVTLLAEKK